MQLLTLFAGFCLQVRMRRSVHWGTLRLSQQVGPEANHRRTLAGVCASHGS